MFARISWRALRDSFAPPAIKEICDHLTSDESRRWKAFAWKAGALFGVTDSLLGYPFVFLFMAFLRGYLPSPWSFVVLFCTAIPVGLLIGVVVSIPFRNRAKWILCQTDYAKGKGFTPDSLQVYRPETLWSALVFAVALPLFVAAIVTLLTIPRAGDPFAILSRMASVYANCKSYRDLGNVSTVFIDQRGRRMAKQPFTTAFVRPDRFRFEFHDNIGGQPTSYIIWAGQKETRIWWTIKPAIEKPASLGLAVGGAAGISGLSSSAIPGLLLPGELGAQLAAITDAGRAEDRTLGNAECFRIAGKFGGQAMTIWIDKKSYLVRRIDTQMTLDKCRVAQTTIYDPIIDQTVANKLLEFDPPVRLAKSDR